MVSKTALELAQGSAAQPLTPEHKRFGALLERVEKARARLQAWQEGLPRFASAHAAQVKPVLQRYDAARREWAFELEQIVLSHRWSEREREVLDHMILDICRALLGAAGGGAGAEDAELKALFNRVSPEDFDSERARYLAALKARLASQSGVDLSDSTATTVDELVRDTRQRLAEQAQAQADDAAQAAEKKPRRRATAAQKRAEAAAEQASRGVREVYRRLAALLHPDRTPPGATEAERQARHEQMSQANAAYSAGDLLTLLTMQLRWEQVDLAQAARMADAKVRQFNQVLARQLADLEEEIRERESTFCSTYGYLPERRPDPAKLDALLKDAVREALAAESTLAHDRRLFRSDPVGLRRLLREIAQEQRTRQALERLL